MRNMFAFAHGYIVDTAIEVDIEQPVSMLYSTCKLASIEPPPPLIINLITVPPETTTHRHDTTLAHLTIVVATLENTGNRKHSNS